MPITLVLADDHHIFRQGLKALLEQEPGISVIGEAESGADAVKRVGELQPDVVILDINMPHLNGIEAAREIAGLGTRSKVLLLSMHTEKEYVLEALKVGVKAIIAKNCIAVDLFAAIHTVAAGGSYLSPTVSGALIDALVDLPHRQEAPPLSQRELQVLRLMVDGKATKEVAATLAISQKTVETYRKHLMEKLNITNLADLVKYALRQGITDLS